MGAYFLNAACFHHLAERPPALDGLRACFEFIAARAAFDFAPENDLVSVLCRHGLSPFVLHLYNGIALAQYPMEYTYARASETNNGETLSNDLLECMSGMHSEDTLT